MTHRLLSILFIFGLTTPIIGCNSKIQNTDKNASTDRFTADSGYILKKEGIAFLRNISSKDSIDIYGSDAKETDTLGKYYKTKTGNYIACLLDIIHPSYQELGRVLIEFTPYGTITKNAKTYGASYTTCFSNNYRDFEKHGDYYSLKICGTGSGYYAGDIALFKEVAPETYTIPATVWSTICVFQADEKTPLACNLTSTISITSDTVTMHYKLEHLEADETEDEKYNLKDTEFFDIKYIKKESGWVALDSTNFSKIPM